jgi:Tfp pilus assembly protein PilF
VGHIKPPNWAGSDYRNHDWLEKAKTAPRYEPRHFPYMNLGRIYAQKWMVGRAIQEFEAALKIHPGEPTCLAALGQLRGSLN